MGGWTGTVLRVDLTTGLITKEPITKYLPFLGGIGLGYKVLWDEVPPGTKAWAPANRIIFGGGPLTGTGTPLSARVSVTSLWPNHPEELPASGHMGGHWGPELKYAGWDSIIVQGKAAYPVWIKIVDDKVTIEDARRLWGNGIYRATAEICTIMGSDAHVAAIGQAGENLCRLSCVLCDRSHSAGGVGSVMGYKNLKAIGVKGTGSLKIAADKATWKTLIQYYLSLIGANNQTVVPKTLQAWAEHSPAGTGRWWADKGLYWGAATPPVETGICADFEHPSNDCPSPQNKIGLRTHKGFGDFGAEGAKRTVKMSGCHACPICCHIATDIPALENYGVSRYNMNTCIGNSIASAFYPSTSAITAPPTGAATVPASAAVGGFVDPGNAMLVSQMSSALCDDVGFWSDYSLVANDFKWYYKTRIVADANNPATIPDPANPGGPAIPNPMIGKTVLQKYLTTAEYNRWNTATGGGNGGFKMMLEANAGFLQLLVPDIAANKMLDGTPATYEKMLAGQPATLGAYIALGAARLAKLWPELQAAHNDPSYTAKIGCWKAGHAKHHEAGQVGGLINMMWNRDAQMHTHSNFLVTGLPGTVNKVLANGLFNQGNSIFNATDGSDALAAGVTSMNMAKAAFVAQSIVYLELHNSLTQCNYTLPVWASPLKSRNYAGDASLEAQTYSAVTGDMKTQKDLELVGLRIYTLFRALTARYMEHVRAGDGAAMRTTHDYVYDWAFASGGWDRADMEVGKDLLYDQLGYDRTTGLPTSATYTSLGMSDVATAMAAAGLLP